MDQAIFDELERMTAAQGAAAATDHLIAWLRERADYTSLFYALLMKARQELGVSPIPTGAAKDLPESVHAPYEEAIRAACRHVGRLCLDAGNLPQAWAYYRMLGEPASLKDALEAYQPKPDEDIQGVIQVAYYEGVHPRRGFDLILERNGLCNAITTLSGSQELGHAKEDRQYCIRRLIRTLYDELCERLSAEITRREGTDPRESMGEITVPKLLAGRDWLFEDEFAHIDVSHLSAVVQMSIHLDPCKELDLARELCDYGRRLPKKLTFRGEDPFDDLYVDYAVYLRILAGERVDEGIAHFHDKVKNADTDICGTYPAQVLVNLLLRLGRTAEAVAVGRQYLAAADSRHLSCPSVVELCQMAGDYKSLAQTARVQGDTVHYLAGLLAAQKRG
jgi:hypothetical protein